MSYDLNGAGAKSATHLPPKRPSASGHRPSRSMSSVPTRPPPPPGGVSPSSSKSALAAAASSAKVPPTPAIAKYNEIYIQATEQNDGLRWAPAEPPTDTPLAPLEALAESSSFREQLWERKTKRWHPDRPSISLRGKWRTLDELDRIVARINVSRIDSLLVKFSPPAHFRFAYKFLFMRLHVTGLRRLGIDDPLPPAAIPALANFIRSPRSHGLVEIVFDGSALNYEDVAPLAAAVRDNTTLARLCVGACNRRLYMPMRQSCQCFQPLTKMWGHDGASGHLGHIAPILLRNRDMTAKVHKAALRSLVPARILLRAADVAADTSSEYSGNLSTVPRVTAQPYRSNGFTVKRPVRSPPRVPAVHRLPREALARILHFAADETALLTDDQVEVVLEHAADPAALSRVAREIGAGSPDTVESRQVRVEWLSKGGFCWEREVAARLQRSPAPNKAQVPVKPLAHVRPPVQARTPSQTQTQHAPLPSQTNHQTKLPAQQHQLRAPPQPLKSALKQPSNRV
ncbi:hypothetical protein Q8F55_005442 [Vanrija albida]|uniref:Uncharacterized protein n=1 Tax=Vanrija albida TaxID=181172 RepID=A0ABR3Q1N0_9TREE